MFLKLSYFNNLKKKRYFYQNPKLWPILGKKDNKLKTVPTMYPPIYFLLCLHHKDEMSNTKRGQSFIMFTNLY